MKIAILSRNPKLYSTRRLVEAAKQRGHEVRVLDALRCYMNITSMRPSIHYKGENLTGFDAVIPRIGASVTFYGTAVLRQFEMMGVYPLNESVAITRSRDKLRSLQLLARKGIGLPVTGFAHSPDDVQDMLKMVGGAPVVIKLLEGTQGIGVVLAETQKAAESVIEAFMGLKANILVQEFIKEAGGADIRCLVVGDKVVAAMKRQGKEGEFRSNLHRGGSAALIRLTPEERSTAVRAASIMGLNVCGVDILRSNHGPVVMEVNSSPGLEGIETATEKDVAGHDHRVHRKESPTQQDRVPAAKADMAHAERAGSRSARRRSPPAARRSVNLTLPGPVHQRPGKRCRCTWCMAITTARCCSSAPRYTATRSTASRSFAACCACRSSNACAAPCWPSRSSTCSASTTVRATCPTGAISTAAFRAARAGRWRHAWRMCS